MEQVGQLGSDHADPVGMGIVDLYQTLAIYATLSLDWWQGVEQRLWQEGEDIRFLVTQGDT